MRMQAKKKTNSEAFIHKYHHLADSVVNNSFKKKANDTNDKMKGKNMQKLLNSSANYFTNKPNNSRGSLINKEGFSKTWNTKCGSKYIKPSSKERRQAFHSIAKEEKGERSDKKRGAAAFNGSSKRKEIPDKKKSICNENSKGRDRESGELTENIDDDIEEIKVSVNILKYSGGGFKCPSHASQNSEKDNSNIAPADKFELMRGYFDKVIREDKQFGELLKEIKKAYEEKIDSLNEMIKSNIGVMSKAEESKARTTVSEDNKNQQKEKHIEVRSKSLAIPRLDLSKVQNKYKDEKIIIIDGKTKDKYELTPKRNDIESSFKKLNIDSIQIHKNKKS